MWSTACKPPPKIIQTFSWVVKTPSRSLYFTKILLVLHDLLFHSLSDLVVTTLLALSFLWSSVNFELPTVTYIKAIDIYFMVSFFFILMSVFEYTLVMNTDFRRKSEKKRDCDRKISVTSKRMLPPSSKSLLIKHYPKKSMKYNEVSSFFFQYIHYYEEFFKLKTLPQNVSVELYKYFCDIWH